MNETKEMKDTTVAQQIEQLKNLQGVLVEKLAIEKQLNEIPKNIIVKKELLERIRARYSSNSETREKKQQELARLRVELEQTERDREKLEGQIEHVNTQREYEALEKEIRERSDRENAIREHQEILKTDIVQLGESIEQERELTHEQEEDLLKEEASMSTQSEQLRTETERLGKDELHLATGFSTEFLFKFQRIISTMGGSGIVPLTSTVCSGCHMILPNHIVNEVRREKEILFCPYCSKVLYYAVDTDNEEGKKVTDADIVEEFEGSLGGDINFDDIFDNKDTEEEYEEPSEVDDDLADADDDEVQEEDGTEYHESPYEGGAPESSHATIDDADSGSYVAYDEDGDEKPSV